MKAKINSSVEREYRLNIKKAYWFRFFKSAHFFSAVLIPFYLLWGKISFTEIMILQAIFTFSMFLLEIPTGVVADWFGRKTSLVLAGVTGIFAPLIYVAYPSFWVFAFAEFVWAIGATLISGADSALIYDSLKATGDEKKSKKVMSRYDSFGLAGIFVAAPIGGLIAQLWGPMMPMMLTSVPMVGALLIALTFKEPKEYKKKKAESYWKTLKGGVKYLREHKELRILMFDYVLIGTLAFFMIWVYQVILQSYNVPLGWFGFIHAGIIVGEILVLNNIERIEKLFGGKKNYLTYSAFIVGALFLVLAFVPNVYLAVVSVFFVGAFGLTRKTIFSSYLNKFIESHNRATVLSVIAMFYSLSMAVIDVVLGAVVDWNLTVGLAVVGFAIILFAFLSRLEEEHLID